VSYPDNKPRGVAPRVAPKGQLGPRVVAAETAAHVKDYAKADAGSPEYAAPTGAAMKSTTTPMDTTGHAVIPKRFQGARSSVPPKASAAAPAPKNREQHPAAAPHPAHSRRANRR
jgi:hypothetical protein